jgi:hypothetical protein
MDAAGKIKEDIKNATIPPAKRSIIALNHKAY